MTLSCLSEETLALLSEGRLAASEWGAAVAHLATCDACRRVLAELARDDDGSAAPTLDRVDATTAAERAHVLDAHGEGDLAPGDEVGRYRILSRVGRGGMGVVFAAYDSKLDRKVALKFLRATHVLDGDDGGSRARERLEREARAMARVSHPNVVAVYDVGVHEGELFVAMEFVEGRTLGAWLAEKARAWAEILAVFVDAGRGLAAAHAAGFVHRDFKPDNVLVGWDGRARVADFGLARVADSAAPAASVAADALARTTEGRSGGSYATLTHAGALLGTPRYMAPEQLDGEVADARSDLFGFCVALFEALFGEHPFTATSLRDLRDSMRSGEVRVPVRATSPPIHVRAALVDGLRVDPRRRPASMNVLLARLSVDPRRRLRRRLWIAAALGVCATGVSAFATWSATRTACVFEAPLSKGAWDDVRRAEVARALGALPFGATYLSPVAATLDRYAAELEATRRSACEATTVRGEQSAALLDRRMTCLDKRRMALGALVDRLVHADVDIARNAAGAAGRLPPVSECSDAETLLAEVPPPDGAASRAAVAAIRARIAWATARFETGDYKGGASAAQAALDDAKKVGYAPALAEALYVRGRFLETDAADEQAKATYKAAVSAAIAGRDDRLTVRIAARLTALVAGRDARDDRSRDWYDVGRAIAARVGGSALLEGQLAERRARALVVAGRYDEATSLFNQAETSLAQALGPGHLEVATVLAGSASPLYNRGSTTEARAAHARARRILESALGPEHPEVLTTLAVSVHLEPPELAPETARTMARAAGLLAARLGPDHPFLITMNHAAAHALKRANRLKEAVAMYRRTVTLAEKRLGAGHRRTEHARADLGTALALLRSPEAISHLTQALEAFTKLGPSSPRLATYLEGLAMAHVQLRQPARVFPVLARARELRRTQPGVTDAMVAVPLFLEGEAHRLLGRAAAAQTSYQRAVALLERTTELDMADLGEALVGLAQVLLVRGQRSNARAHLERAMPLLAAPKDAEALATARLTLAKVLAFESNERGRARPLAKQARAYFASHAHLARERDEADAWLRRHP